MDASPKILLLYSLRPKDKQHVHIKAILQLGFDMVDISRRSEKAVLDLVSQAPNAKIIFLCHVGGRLMVRFGKSIIDLQGDLRQPGFIEQLGEATKYAKDILFLSCHVGQLSGINWRKQSAELKARLYHISTEFSLSFQNARQILEGVAQNQAFEPARGVVDVDGSTYLLRMTRKEERKRGLLGDEPNADEQHLEESFHDLSDDEW